MKTKKRYGQHFLVNKGVQQKIVAAIEEYVPEGHTLLEVGPGQGVLTQYLVEKNYDYKVIEIDEDMVSYLQTNLPSLKKEQLIFDDVLKVPAKKFFDDKPFALVGNFPYNISTQLLIKMYENHDLIPIMVGMFQKEVADRVISKSNSKTYGITSVLLQSFYECKRLFNVAPGSFNPPPKVDSSIIALTLKKHEGFDCSPKKFKQVVKAAFQQRRKMIRNTLKQLINDEQILQDELFTKRPEQLEIADFINITQIIENQNHES